MSADEGFVSQVVGALSRALSPLVDASASPQALGALLERLGWDTEPASDVVAAFASTTSAIERLAGDIQAGANVATLTTELTAAIDAVSGLGDLAPSTAAGAPFDDPLFWRELPEELISLLISEDLQANAPGIFGLLSFAGVLRAETRPEDPASGRQAYTARVFDWGILGRTASSPSTWLADAYGWGERFDHARFLESLAALGIGLGAVVSRLSPGDAILAPYVASDNPDRRTIKVYSLSPIVVDTPTLAALVKPALLALPLPPQGSPSEPPEGLLLWPTVTGAAEATVDLGPAASLTLEGDFEATPLRIQIRPGGSSIEDASAGIEMSARVDITPESPFIMVGAGDGTRIELARAHLGIRASGGDASAEIVVDAAIDEGLAVIDLGGADGFLRGVLGSIKSELSVAMGIQWSSSSGLTFSGGTEPAVTIPTSLRVGAVLTISEIRVEFGQADPDATILTVSVTGGFDLGPFAAVVEHMGLRLSGVPAALDSPGNFGQLDLAFGFKPPDAIGFSVQVADVASGGGFLNIAPDEGQYSGILDVEIFGVGITAVGIISTQLPDGSDGWSMFFSLTAEFTGLQIGFGFTLNGVGGLVGVHRGLDEEALGDGVRTGALESILFPADPIVNAPTILADIGAVFPPAADQYVFGPVVKLGWGTPTLIEADLGVVVQLPDPLTVTLLGALEAVLPDEDAPVVELRVDVAGTINLTEGTLRIDASLRDSQVAGLALSGALAVRASFVDSPSFLFSFGGFHPAFASPPGFPTVARLAIGLDTGDDLRITLGSYFAVSSSTLQFGAMCELWAKAVGFTAEGGTSFDALIIYKPFGFTISLNAWVSIAAGKEELLGVLLAGELQGPNRWHVMGFASFKVLGLKASLDVEARFGSAEDEEPREVIDVEALLIEALRDPDAWSVLPADGPFPGVVLAETDSDSLQVHPAGAIEVRQRVVPLGERIEQYGNAGVEGADEFTLGDGKIGETRVAMLDVEDWFAAAQYWKMKDTERLSAPSFELMSSGVRLEGGGMTAGAPRRFTPDYEVKIRDPSVTLTPRKASRVAPARAIPQRGRRQPIGRVPAERAGARGGPRVDEVKFVPLNKRTGKANTRHAGRYQAVRARIARSADPSSLTVAPSYEQSLD